MDSKEKSPIQETTAELLRRSEQKLSSILASITDCHFELDKDWRFIRINDQSLNYFGRKREELIGQSYFEVFQILKDSIFKEQYTKAVVQSTSVHFDVESILYPGRWVELHAYPTEEGGVSVFFRDITEKKRAEIALHESEKRFRAIANYSYDCEHWFDSNGKLIWVNPAVYRLTGYTVEECMAMPDYPIPLLDSDDRGTLTNYLEEAVQGSSANDVEFRIRCKDGSLRWVAVSWQPIYDLNGSSLGHLSSVRDITDRKKIENQLKEYQEHLEKLVEDRTKKLKESEKVLRNIVENAMEGIFQTTPEGRFLTANRALARIYGYETPEKLIESITNIATEICVHPERRKEFVAIMERDGIVRNFEMEVRTLNGSIRYVLLNARAVKNEQGKMLYFEGMVQDITENKQASELMMAQRDIALKLSQIDKLEEGLNMILQTAVSASGMESGSILLKNNETEGFDLISSVGLTKEFEGKIQYVPKGGSVWTHLMEKKSLHTQTSRHLTPTAFEEGFKIISFMPILEKDEVMGGLVMASKVLEKIPDQVRIGLEFLAAQSGNSIARMQARGQLEAEITVRKEAEKTLSMKSRNLEEVNTALKVLLEQREQDKNELEDKILFNVRKLILPYIDSLKQRRLDYEQTTYLDVLETNLKNIISPFAKKLTSIHEKFTPQEIKVADLIRDGKTVKEISLAFGVSESAINVHRQHIRNKLGLNNQKINLRTYLLSLA
jgi:PAS domain S-box-containing protein